jgi:PHP family Zn ribbon phosphoesterase
MNIVLYTKPLPVISKTYLYTGVRLATACRLRVKDFHHQAAPHAQVSIRRRIRDRVREYCGIAIMHLRRRPGYWKRRVRAEIAGSSLMEVMQHKRQEGGQG